MSTFLWRVCMLSPCQRGLSQSYSFSSYCPKAENDNSKASLVVSVHEQLFVSVWACDGVVTCSGSTAPFANWLQETGTRSLDKEQKHIICADAIKCNEKKSVNNVPVTWFHWWLSDIILSVDCLGLMTIKQEKQQSNYVARYLKATRHAVKILIQRCKEQIAIFYISGN